MTKNQLIGMITKILQADDDLEFLLRLDEKELTILVAAIRARVDCVNEGQYGESPRIERD